MTGQSHPSALAPAELAKSCTFRTLRRGGPGGQHRNKVETAVVATHTPSGISAEANERRSQQENRRQALLRLRVNLALELRTPNPVPRSPTDPSPLWRSRCQGGKLHVNASHEDFPALLAEALDCLAGVEFDLTEAAGRLRISASQLVKFLKNEARAMALVNAERRRRGLPPRT